jgi:hypothetical protein
MAKPVVAFDLPENRVSAGDAALYATNNCEREFASLIDRLMDDPYEREVLGRRGRQRVLDHFTWEKQSSRLIELYDGLLGAGQGSAQSIATDAGASPAWSELTEALEPSGDGNKVLA